MGRFNTMTSTRCLAIALTLAFSSFGVDVAAAANGKSAAQISADFQGASCTSVAVASSKDLGNVILLFADGTWQKFDRLGGTKSGNFQGSGGHAGKTITTAYVKSGSGKSGKKDGLPGMVGVEFTSPCAGGVDVVNELPS